MVHRNLILLLLFLISLSSCISNKKIIYLQNNTGIPLDSLELMSYNRYDYKIQVDDILSVNVRSTDPKATSVFNNSYTLGNQVMAMNDLSLYYNGYSVNDSGFVDLPVVGDVKVLGLTLKEAKTIIEKAVNEYFVNSYITVKLNGIRYSILGEVRRPGKYQIYENQVTIFEAISQGGDLTTLADRKKIMVLRHYPEGAKTHELDLLDQNIIHSPYYFIQTNDVVYVKPLKRREIGTGITGMQTIQAIATVLSLGLLIANLLK